MSNLDFLEISRNFKSYYRTLRDAHFYLTNDPELDKEELQAVTKVLSKLIYGFISIKGTSFREMDREQFEQEFNLFHQDFLSVIKNSGENNVSFDEFTALIDEIIAIAVKRTMALAKIKKSNQELLFEDDESVEVSDNDLGVNNEDEDHDAGKELVFNEPEESADIEESGPEDLARPAVLRTFSTDFNTPRTNANGIVVNGKIEPENDVVVPEVINEVKIETKKPEKVKNNYVDAAPIVNKYNDNESDEDFRFRPRRRNR